MKNDVKKITTKMGAANPSYAVARAHVGGFTYLALLFVLAIMSVTALGVS